MSNPDGKFDVTRDVADGAQQGQAFVAPAGGVGRGPVCREISASGNHVASVWKIGRIRGQLRGATRRSTGQGIAPTGAGGGGG